MDTRLIRLRSAVSWTTVMTSERPAKEVRLRESDPHTRTLTAPWLSRSGVAAVGVPVAVVAAGGLVVVEDDVEVEVVAADVEPVPEDLPEQAASTEETADAAVRSRIERRRGVSMPSLPSGRGHGELPP